MSLIGYCRVSSADQNLDIQIEALEQAGCERIFKEKASGRNVTDRPVWAECVAFLREGDVLVFTRLDRIARSTIDLMQIGQSLDARGIGIRCLQQNVDTSTSEGRLLWGILALVAEFEVDLKKERQREGIARAKTEGKYTGGKRRVDREAVAKLKAAGKGARAIAKALNCDPKTVYRAHPDGWGDAPIRRS